MLARLIEKDLLYSRKLKRPAKEHNLALGPVSDRGAIWKIEHRHAP